MKNISNSHIYGLDAYRILSMMMITSLHVINQHYHLLDKDNPWPQFTCSILLYIISYCGVNCFALLSGFLLCDNKWEYDEKLFRKLTCLWIKVLLYFFIIWVIILIGGNLRLYPLRRQLTPRGVINALFIFTYFPWWYISAYMGLMLLLPLILKVLNVYDSYELLKISIVLFICYSVLPFVSRTSGALSLTDGYSTIWLLICFIFGAFLKRNIDSILKIQKINIIVFFIFCICVSIPLAFCLFMRHLGLSRWTIFLNYISPLCVLEAVCLLIFTYQLKPQNPKLCNLLVLSSTNSLGIYLFQCHPGIWSNFLMPGKFEVTDLYNMVIKILGGVTLICFIGIIFNICIEKIYQFFQLDKVLCGLSKYVTEKFFKTLRSKA